MPSLYSARATEQYAASNLARHLSLEERNTDVIASISSQRSPAFDDVSNSNGVCEFRVIAPSCSQPASPTSVCPSSSEQ